MMRSMYTAVSGLRTHQGKMDTIGNNIANVNTVGFKRGQVTFKDAFSQMMTGASAPQEGLGGTNPQQIGMGINLGAISNIHTVGNAQRTDNPTDLMINGEGFFTVSNDTGFNNRFFTRDGSFSLDRDGNLVTSEGYKVLGYRADENGNISDTQVSGIRINKSDTAAPRASTDIEFKGNLDSNTDIDGYTTMNTIIYDSLGNEYELTFKAEKSENGKWDLNCTRITDTATGNYQDDNGEALFGFSTELNFDTNGSLVGIGGADNIADGFDLVELDLSDVSFNKDKENNDLDANIEPAGDFGNDGKISIFDYNREDSYKSISQYANDTDLKPYRMDGRTSGTLDSFTIDASGVVLGIFSNGSRRPLGQIMLTKFDNPMGLEKMGSNLFMDTRNSGEPQYGVAGGRGFGAIAGGNLEMSNVDISFEFTEMITTQRGFQANSRVITTSDEMLQELVNIKR